MEQPVHGPVTLKSHLCKMCSNGMESLCNRRRESVARCIRGRQAVLPGPPFFLFTFPNYLSFSILHPFLSFCHIHENTLMFYRSIEIESRIIRWEKNIPVSYHFFSSHLLACQYFILLFCVYVSQFCETQHIITLDRFILNQGTSLRLSRNVNVISDTFPFFDISTMPVYRSLGILPKVSVQQILQTINLCDLCDDNLPNRVINGF